MLQWRTPEVLDPSCISLTCTLGAEPDRDIMAVIDLLTTMDMDTME